MLLEEVKRRVLAALKAGRSLEKEILRVALGELQTIEARKGEISDDEAAAVIRKLIKSNRETLELARTDEQKTTLEQEIVILETLLPKALDAEGVAAALASVKDAIRAAASDGQATGIAMKTLKAQGTTVDGKLVGDVVKKLRG
jgi:uncharacterized protein YqeY